MASNPFTPTFGVVPAFMAEREDITSELLAALEEGVGNPNLTTSISGARGTGRTALLIYLSDAAQAQGWAAGPCRLSFARQVRLISAPRQFLQHWHRLRLRSGRGPWQNLR